MATLSTSTIANREVNAWRLIIPRPLWDRTMRQLIVDPQTSACGRVVWRRLAEVGELMVSELSVITEIPSGDARSPLADWIVITLCDAVELATIESFAHYTRRFHRQPSQMLVCVAVDRNEHAQWNGVVIREDRIEPIDEVRVIGAERLEWHRDAGAERRGESAGRLRWSRTRGALGDEVVERIRTSSATLVGCGRNGSAIAFQLAALGINQLRLVDDDVLRLENLDAMPGLILTDVGRLKIDALAERLLAFRPDLQLTLLAKSARAPEAVGFLRERVDLLISCVDNDVARLAISLAARETLTVHLDVASSVQRREPQNVLELSADARLLLPTAGCVACVGGLADAEETRYELFAPPGALSHRVPRAWDQERAGSLITINSIAVGAGLQMWIDLIAGRLQSSFWQRIAWSSDRQGLVSNAATVGASDTCEICRTGR